MKWFTFFANSLTFTGVPLALPYEARFGRAVQWLALRTNRLAFAGVPLALPYKARFGRAVQWLALRTNRLGFRRTAPWPRQLQKR